MAVLFDVLAVILSNGIYMFEIYSIWTSTAWSVSSSFYLRWKINSITVDKMNRLPILMKQSQGSENWSICKSNLSCIFTFTFKLGLPPFLFHPDIVWDLDALLGRLLHLRPHKMWFLLWTFFSACVSQLLESILTTYLCIKPILALPAFWQSCCRNILGGTWARGVGWIRLG